MVRRSIILIPKFPNIETINELRKRYDPLAGKTPPHITLVFPFESSYTIEELSDHITKTLVGFRPFEIRLQGITGGENGYLFLNVKKGNDQIIEMHDRLYSGMLSDYLYWKVTYFPHLTVGRVCTTGLHDSALQITREFQHEFVTTVGEIVVERIDDNEVSHFEFIHRFESSD